MPSLSNLPDNISVKKFQKALSKLGFEVSERGGKGSHWKATCVKTQKSVTIPSKIRKDVLFYVLKEIKECSGIEWDDIRGKM